MHHNEEQPAPIIQLLPADGWRVYYFDEDDNSWFSAMVVGWALRTCGCVVPLGVLYDGLDIDDLRVPNTVAILHDGEPELEEKIAASIDDWKDREKELEEATHSTKH